MICMKKSSLTMALLGAALAMPAAGQDTIGLDDFDGNGDFLTRAFSPDNAANNGAFTTPTGFFGPFFDRFGIMDQTVGVGGPASEASVPFDFLDSTTTGVADDRLGIFRSTDMDNFVGIADLENNDNTNGNSGAVTWTYDISGYENINVAMDWAAVGNFVTSDNIALSASIDGGSSQAIISGAGSAGTAYNVTMESGAVHNSYANQFFSESDWTNLTTLGPLGTITFSDDDVNQDGFLDGVTDLDSGLGVRVYQETGGNFAGDETDFNLFDSQFIINGVGITNEIQTISADVAGTGSTLTLTLDVEQNGSFQFLAFDDLLITGDLIASGLVGDYNGNGTVDSADYTIWADNFNSTTELAADGNGDGTIDGADYTVWADNFGNTAALSSGAFPIPEPSAGLILAGLGLIAARRRRQA